MHGTNVKIKKSERFWLEC